MSSLCVCLTCYLIWLIMHGILPIPIIRKGNVCFPGQLYVQSPENIVKQSSKLSYFGKKKKKATHRPFGDEAVISID